ncbi:MAG: ABC-ATPase domain-containing protein [Kiritimatiellae bacterium]|nr:ABC-ATPase domain-containing protein [Kiritimatiellia bacterium]
MRDRKEFQEIVRRIDGGDFAEYAQIVGDYDFTRFILKIADVQAAPDADYTLFLVTVPQHVAGFPAELFSSPIRRTALEDLLIREVASKVEELADFDECGVAVKRLHLAMPAPQILPRSALTVTHDSIELRIKVSLPASSGCIDGGAVSEIFFSQLAELIDSALIYCNLDAAEIHETVSLMEEADQIRQMLPTQGLVSIISDGTCVDSIEDEDEVFVFRADETVKTHLDIPEYGAVTGVAIPAGITLILGTDKQGRQELMQAVSDGIYNHVAGDGRDRCVTVPDAVYIAGSPGRPVQRVDLSPFVAGDAASDYSTEDADEFVSQAASVMEALTAGARVLVMDEADSAPGFLSFDSRLEGLIPELNQEYIPLANRAREIVDSLGVSLVIGGAYAVADLIPVADTVLLLSGGTIKNITRQAREALSGSVKAAPSVDMASIVEKFRWIVPSSIDPSIGIFDARTSAMDIDMICFGRYLVDMGDVFQLVDECQTETIGLIMEYAKHRYLAQPRPLRELLDMIDRDLSTEGLECLTREQRCDMARPRRYEIAAAFNRLCTLRVMNPPE